MADGMQQVLDMLASGTISPEEAAELLDALRDVPATAASAAGAWQGGDVRRTARRERRHRDRELRPELKRIAQAATFGVDADFVREMRALGFTNLTADEWIEMAKFGVDRDFVEGLRRLGYTDLTPMELAEMACHGADAEFVEAMTRAGYTDLSAGELVKLAISGVDAETIATLRELGLAETPVHSTSTRHARPEPEEEEEGPEDER